MEYTKALKDNITSLLWYEFSRCTMEHTSMAGKLPRETLERIFKNNSPVIKATPLLYDYKKINQTILKAAIERCLHDPGDYSPGLIKYLMYNTHDSFKKYKEDYLILIKNKLKDTNFYNRVFLKYLLDSIPACTSIAERDWYIPKKVGINEETKEDILYFINRLTELEAKNIYCAKSKEDLLAVFNSGHYIKKDLKYGEYYYG